MTAQDPPKHGELAKYFAPRYPELSEQQVLSKITSDPDAFESSLKLMHKENYASRDYQTFRSQYLKEYGDPFTEPKKEVNETFAGQQLGYQYSWGESKPTELAQGDYSTSVNRASKETDLDYRNRKVAYETITQKRKDNLEMTADEYAVATLEKDEWAKARMNGRTAYEILVGADKGQKREYDYRMNALGEEIATIDQAIEHSVNELKSEYGEDFFERLNRAQLVNLIPGLSSIPSPEDEKLQQDIAKDEKAIELQRILDLRERNINRAKELLKDEDFNLARVYGESIEEIQSQADASGDPLRGPNSLIMRTFGKALKALGSVGQVIEAGVIGDEQYGASNIVWDFMRDAGESMESAYPMQSRNSRPMFTQTAVYERAGEKYQIDFDKGKPVAIRNNDGMLIENPFSQSEMAEIEKLQPEEQVNYGAAIYKTADVLADLGVQIGLSKGATSLVSKAGLTKAMSAKAGVTMGTAAQMAGPMLDQGEKLFPNDRKKAAQYAFMTSGLIGLSANMFGLESKLVGGGGSFLDNFFGNAVTQARMRALAKGGASPVEIAGAVATEFVKAGAGETFEETVLEAMIDSGVRDFMGAERAGAVDWREAGETAAISFAVGILGAAGPIAGDVKKGALEVASNDPGKYRKELETLIQNGVVRVPNADPADPDYQSKVSAYVASQQQRMEDIGASYKAMAPALGNVPKGEVLALLDKRRDNIKQIERLEAAGATERIPDIKTENLEIEEQLSELSNGRIQFKRAEEITPESAAEPIKLMPVEDQQAEPTTAQQAEPTTAQQAEPTVSQQVAQVENAVQQTEQQTAQAEQSTPLLTEQTQRTAEIIGQDTEIDVSPSQMGGIVSNMLNPPASVQKMLDANEDALIGGTSLQAVDLTTEEALEAEAWIEAQLSGLAPIDSKYARALESRLKNFKDAIRKVDRPTIERGAATEAGRDTPDTGAIERGRRVEPPKLNAAQRLQISETAKNPESTPENLLEAARLIEPKRAGKIKRRIDGLLEAGNEEAAQAQVESLRQELAMVSGDSVEAARESIPGFSQEAFDKTIDEAAEVMELSGKNASAIRAMKGLPPAEGITAEQILQDAYAAEPEPGSGLDPTVPVFVESPSTATVEELEEALPKITQAILDTKKAKRLARKQAESADYGSLTGDDLRQAIELEVEARLAPLRSKISDLWAQRAQIASTLQALRPSNAESQEAYQARMSREAGQEGPQINRAGMGFMLGDAKMLQFFYGMAGGKTGVDIQIAVKKFWNNIRKYTVGALPKAARMLNINRVNEINAQMARADILSRQLGKAAKAAKIDMKDPATARYMNEALRHPDLMTSLPMRMPVTQSFPNGRDMPTDVRARLIDMRQHIDAMSLTLMQSGLTDGPLMDVLTENMGVYVHRSYQIHNDPDWIEKVQKDPDIWNPGVAWWVGELQSMQSDLVMEINKINQSIADNKAKLGTINPFTAPKTAAKIQASIDYNEQLVLEKQDALDIVNAKIASPAASLEHLLRGQQAGFSGGGGKLGTKDFGIFQLRGGSAKRKEINELKKKLNKARKQFQKAEAKVNRLERTAETTEEVDKAFADMDKAWDKVEQLERDIAEAYDKDIPPELRSLYGEYTSVLTNYVHTIYKQSTLAANHKFLNEVREAGLSQGWLRTPNDPSEDYTQEIAAESSSVMAPLNGLLTSPEIAKAFEDYNKSYRLPLWIAGWMKFSGITKKWLTVYSPVGHIRNINTGGYFHMLSGDFAASPAGPLLYLNGILESVGKVVPRLNYVKNSVIGPAIQSAANRIAESDNMPSILRDMFGVVEDIKEANKQAFRVGRDVKAQENDIREYQEYVELGLTDESAEFGIVMDSINQFRDGFTSPYGSLSPGAAMTGGMSEAKKVREFAERTYQASDTAHRILKYKRDLRRYALSRGIPLEALGPGQEMDFKREIADIARRTYPTYSRMPEIVTAVGKSPLIGPFISFHYTAAEAAVNNITQGVRDIQQGDRAIGISRMVGTALTNVIYGTALKAMGGLITGGILGITSGPTEDEDDDDNKWTHFLPPWSKYSQVSIFPTGRGDFVYIDHGTQVPNATIFETIESALQGNFDRAGNAFMKEVIGPFISADVFTKTAAEAIINAKDFNSERPISYEEDPVAAQAAMRAAYMLDRVQPGVFSTAQRIRTAYKNYIGQPDYEDYKNYNIGVELMVAGTGIRVSTGDVGLSYSIKMNKLNKDLNQGLSVYRNKARRIKKDEPYKSKAERLSELSDSKEKAEMLATKSIEKMISMYKAAQKTGLSQSELSDLLKKSRVPLKTREGIQMGIVILPDLDNLD